MGRIAIFIDGGYISRILKDEFGKASVDFLKLAQEMAGSCELLRCYYYDALPYVQNPPTEEQSDRLSKKQRFFYSINHLPRFEVKLGRTEARGYDGNGELIVEQKRVDILLGVDLTVLAVKRLITDAAVLAGDSDFMPAVQAAKAEGVIIRLIHGSRAHTDLVQEADECVRIDQAFIDRIRR